jgi:putative Ca2+/H+ antiporter (TMEM165/GDT1 family)
MLKQILLTLNKDIHNNNNDFWQGFSGGLSLVFISGFGDKTFFLNMLYVSINPFWEALFVSLTVSELMNMISIFLGKVIPIFISRDTLDWCAIVIFLFFGGVMLYQGITEQNVKLLSTQIARENECDDEEKLLRKDTTHVNVNNDNDNNDNALTDLGAFDTWWKYCIAYMVGELGDKSQIATIVVTAKYNFTGVFVGTALAQLLLVMTAILIGKSISGLLTNKQISILGGVVFVLFALVYLADKLV